VRGSRFEGVEEIPDARVHRRSSRLSGVLKATAFLVFAFPAVATAAFGANLTESVKLTAVGGSGVHGVATAGARGKGTQVRFVVRGLQPGAEVRAVMQAGTCAKSSASFAAAGRAEASEACTSVRDAQVRSFTLPFEWSVQNLDSR
jgi:hypothetical protein